MEQREKESARARARCERERECSGENGRAKAEGRLKEDAGRRERIPEALSFNQIHYTEFIAARELIKCRRINSRRSKAECLHEI